MKAFFNSFLVFVRSTDPLALLFENLVLKKSAHVSFSNPHLEVFTRHFKLTSLFLSGVHPVDIVAYPVKTRPSGYDLSTAYVYFTFKKQIRVFLFLLTLYGTEGSSYLNPQLRSASVIGLNPSLHGTGFFFKYNRLITSPESLEFVFGSFWWLEREVSELLGLRFNNKVDARNLLLEYTNVLKPLARVFPTEGFFEIYFNTSRDSLMQIQTRLQS